MSERLIDRVQKAYNDNRAPETWGTPQVSPVFFDNLRSEGVRGAWKYLVERERTMGDLSAKPKIKAVANIAGSTLLVLGVRQMSSIGDKELHGAEYVPSAKQKVGDVLFSMTLGLLFFAQDGGSTHMGYLGKDPSEWNQRCRADLTGAEQANVESAFDSSQDGCQMDTIARIYPDKLEEV